MRHVVEMFRDDLDRAGHPSEMLSDFQQPGGGNGQGIGFRRRAAYAVDLHLVGPDAFRQAGDGVHGGVIVAYAAEQHDFEPDLPIEGTAEGDQPFDDAIEIKGRGGAVHLVEQRGVASVQRGDHHIGGGEVGADFRHPQQGAVGEHHHRNVRHGLDAPDDVAEPGVQRGFAGSGETDVFGLVPVFELAAHFVKDIRGGDIFLALDGVVRSPSELAIHAVERTAFEGQGVHAERTAQTPGRNRAVHMFEASVHVLSFSRGIARVRCHAPEMPRRSGFAFVRAAFDGFESPLAHARVGGDGFPCLGIIPGKGIFPVPALGRQHEAFQKRGPRFRSFGELRLQGPDMLGIDVVGDLFIGMAP